jgi:iron complex outermembrane receptor protein
MQDQPLSMPERMALVVLILAASCLSGPRVSAQTPASDETLEEVIVTTARLREEQLIDVPASITAITNETLEQAAVERAGDFVRLTPGVSLVQAAEVADAQVNIRGINGARDAENSFALIVDGILLTNPAAFNREYQDLQQIEILKGPQGALYGRNAAAGAIIVTTRKPGDKFEGEVKAGYAEDQTMTGAVSVGGPLGDTTRFRLSADYRKTDGFYENVFLNDSVVDDFEGINVNARLLFEPSDDLEIDMKARYGTVDAASISFNAAFALSNVATAFGVPEFFEDVNQHPFVFNPNIDPDNEQDTIEASVKADWDLGANTLTAWVLYSDVDNAFSADGTSGAFGFFFADAPCRATTAAQSGAGVTLPPPQFLGPTPEQSIFGPYTSTDCDGTQYQVRDQRDYSFEMRLTSPSDQRLRWLAGVYYLNIDRQVGVNLGIDRGAGVTEELFVPASGSNPTESLVYDDFDSDVYAVFGQLAFDLTDNLELAAALRYDREERQVHSLVPTEPRTQYIDFNPADGVFTGGAPLNPALNPAINPDGAIPDRERTFDQVEPKVSLTWEPTDGLTLYANAGIGFKSGGFNNSGSAATVDLFINSITGNTVSISDEFEKEVSRAYEVGAKSSLAGGRVQLEGAVYKTDVDDMQFFEFFVGGFGLLRVVNTIDEVSIQGFELAATAKVTDNLRLIAGYSRVDSEIDKNDSRPTTVGNSSPYTPDYTATAGVEFDMTTANSWKWQASAFANLVGPTWFHTIQNDTNQTGFAALFGPVLGLGDYSRMRRDDYYTIDARLALGGDRWTVAIIGKNITDEQWLQEVIVAPEFGGAFIHPGSERRVGAEVSFRF